MWCVQWLSSKIYLVNNACLYVLFNAHLYVSLQYDRIIFILLLVTLTRPLQTPLSWTMGRCLWNLQLRSTCTWETRHQYPLSTPCHWRTTAPVLQPHQPPNTQLMGQSSITICQHLCSEGDNFTFMFEIYSIQRTDNISLTVIILGTLWLYDGSYPSKPNTKSWRMGRQLSIIELIWLQ